MRKRPSYILLLLLLLGACIKETPRGADLKVGDALPAFTVQMNDGRWVSNEELKEGVSCIVFFTTECSDCQKTLPQVQQAYQVYQAQGVRFVLIAREQSHAQIQAYWEKVGLNMPYSPQEGRTVYAMFAYEQVPRIYVCKEGVIAQVLVAEGEKTPSYEDIKVAIDGVL